MTNNLLATIASPADLRRLSRAELRTLWSLAFGDRFSDDDAEHAFGGAHVLAHEGGRLLGHAAAVPRRLRFGDAPWCTVGYVEAVAVAPDRQGEGLGRTVMGRLQEEIARRWPVAVLSTGRATGFYERLGWERWQGASYTGGRRDDAHGGLMVLRVDPAVAPDLDADLTCEDRVGSAW